MKIFDFERPGLAFGSLQRFSTSDFRSGSRHLDRYQCVFRSGRREAAFSAINPNFAKGFALVTTLVILAMTTIMVLAFTSTMRTERSASEHFSERERAQAIALGTLNRILAEHASPEIGGGQRLKRFEVELEPPTKLPTSDTKTVYYADPPAPGIYSMVPTPGISTDNGPVADNGLVGLSRSTGAAKPAYNSKYWAYAGQQGEENLFPQDSGGPTTPQWVPYKDANDEQLGEVAYAIWEEAGKFDINMAGEDEAINGLAPHNLEVEKNLADESEKLLTYLNNNGTRDRNNFSLRRVDTDSGDDRWFFSMEEVMGRDLVSTANAKFFTTFSRDFEVRPEWDGVRSAETAKSYLKSYVNNPTLFKLYGELSGKYGKHIGPDLVTNDMNESIHRAKLGDKGLDDPEEIDDWLQIMRLLAALRIALPEATVAKHPGRETPLPLNQWYDSDIYGTALNIAQAGSPLGQPNLIARGNSEIESWDPDMLVGIRASPYITEVAVKVHRIDANTIEITEYVELWNPYAVDLSNQTYQVMSGRGSQWPQPSVDGSGVPGGIRSNSQAPKDPLIAETRGPRPGEFLVVKAELNSAKSKTPAKGKVGNDFEMCSRIFIKGPEEGSVAYGAPANSADPRNLTRLSKPYNLIYRIPAKKNGEPYLDKIGSTHWFSFQIDDPRMGPVLRHAPNWNSAEDPNNGMNMTYSWKAYPDSHSLYGIEEGPKYPSPHGDGYNQNFLDPANIPSGWKNLSDSEKKQRALATFALPRRPLADLSELANVFAFRPWRTLGFGASAVPDDSSVEPPSDPANYPAALLDYFTTLGTTTRDTNLPNDSDDRKQGLLWLFEKVEKDADGEDQPAGNLRPIRGRINLNTAHRDLLVRLLSAPYSQLRYVGSPEAEDGADEDEFEQEITETEAQDVVDDLISIRPLRRMADLGRLETNPHTGETDPDAGISKIRQNYPGPVADSVLGRLAKFGTIRQQAYTIDLVARATHPKDPEVVTAEVRLLARVYFDTFSRRAFIESIEYR